MRKPGVELGTSAWKTTKLTFTPSKVRKISRYYIYMYINGVSKSKCSSLTLLVIEYRFWSFKR